MTVDTLIMNYNYWSDCSGVQSDRVGRFSRINRVTVTISYFISLVILAGLITKLNFRRRGSYLICVLRVYRMVDMVFNKSMNARGGLY